MKQIVLNMQRFKLKEVQVRKIVSQKRICKKVCLAHSEMVSAEEYYLSLFTVIKVHSKHLFAKIMPSSVPKRLYNWLQIYAHSI